MSLRAMLWALHDAPVEDPTAALVLLGLADHARDDGTASWPYRRTLAKYARCSVDTVDRRLRVLLSAGVIVPGDQRLVEHLPADRRPTVYDMVMSARRAVTSDEGEQEGSDIAAGQTGPQTAAPLVDGAAPVRARGRSGAATGAAAVRHRTVLEQSRTDAREATPQRSRYRPPARRGPERVDPRVVLAVPYCARCAHQHDAQEPCSVVAAPKPPDFRAIAAAAALAARGEAAAS